MITFPRRPAAPHDYLINLNQNEITVQIAPVRRFFSPRDFGQGCQMVYFQTKNTNLGKFLRAFDGKMLL
jgi:hypothetical protein